MNVAILEHDLEKELEQWGSFLNKAREFGLSEDLRKTKKAGSIARAVAGASMQDMPEDLKRIINAVLKLATSSI